MLIRTPADLAALIKERRTRLGLDQESLAQKVGVSRKWIVEVEGGKPRAEMGLVLRTLRALDVSLEVNEPAAMIPKTKTPTTPTVVDVNAIVDSLKKKR
jgi:HTH-type transcriptional regulator / antitoxin HipB